MGTHVVIVGAGAGGASVAAEAKRQDPSLADRHGRGAVAGLGGRLTDALLHR